MRLISYFWSLIFLVSSSFNHTKCDYFSSIAGLEDLISLEDFFMDYLAEHISEVEKYSKEIESFLNEVELEQLKIQNDTELYFEDPINAFKTVKRFVVDWKQMEELTVQIHQLPKFSETSRLSAEEMIYPTQDDLDGASRGVSRLQHIYKLHAEDIADGYLGNKKYDSYLTAVDCFTLGKSLFVSQDYLHASEWLILALHKLEDEDTFGMYAWPEEDSNENIYPYVTKIDILEYLGAALYQAGNRKLAAVMNGELLKLDPKNKYGLDNQKLFEWGLKQQRRLRSIQNPMPDNDIVHLYSQVCSGEIQQSPAEQRHLRCRYVTNNVPYYLLGPMKLEELNVDPFVAFYHQIISDKESREIIETAVTTIERSEVGDRNATRIEEDRISKGTWLSFEQYDFLGKISQRLEDITGLSIKSGEPLQVANYGIGGHYAPHLDSSNKPDVNYPDMGNRFLTALLYINDVETGGATAFPYLHLAVPPIKHSLVVWYNLHKSTEVDHRTMHAGCPVIKGSKWIGNEWFHTIGQEFKRPCGLKPDGEISKPYQYFYD